MTVPAPTRLAAVLFRPLLAVALVAAGLGIGSAAEASPVSWSLHDRACSVGVESQLSIACGDLGVLHFGTSDEGSCPASSRGAEVPAPYPRPLAAVAGRSGQRATATAAAAAAAAERPWVAVVDWDDWHGHSVSRLVEEMSLGRVETVLYPLDDPALEVLGTQIGDAHVLASLCRVAEDAATREQPLVAVNMSFGRLAMPTDPRRAAGCDPGTLGCQIANVLDTLGDRGAAPVAAAGNHRELLFPASLEETVASGSIDLFHYGRDRLPQPQWESPHEIDALVPGHGLCIDGRVAPSGSSYASALFTGWFSMLAVTRPGIGALGGSWVPVWSKADRCVLLSRDGEPIRECNPAVHEVFAGLIEGGPQSGCWQAPGADDRPLVTLVPRQEVKPPDVPSFDEWVAGRQHPAPESDPCIPCVGYRLRDRIGESKDIFVAVSESVGIGPGVTLDRLFLRSGDRFYTLDVSVSDRQAFAGGRIGGLLLVGLDRLPEIDAQPSLAYLLKTEADADCSIPGTRLCYWTTTPLMLR